ncbi:RICIN domain-containing protein [Saccharothrix sp. 6-C]|uniref:Poly(3-hydroxybutyrate) depolymerase n=1 Tax=Saccharothrix texasensis TaxID=103734 RepID=A0A3N1HHZ7_9PSEU|nr:MULTISPECIES: RICIN domain-containing protein [Saccharothrix]QQQ73976.1 RICIN domain-containing protein [Saccharothrix sp. 6-C]ROP42128.1 poly(3-hydroxybutyrate) depolymerase [Saccharothrix texasensis]
MTASGEALASPQTRRRRPVTAAAVAVLLAAGTVTAVAATPASAATVDTSAWYVLVNRNSGKALDVYGLATNDGGRIAQWTRNDGANQQWQFLDSGGGYYRLKSRHSGKVLDVPNSSTADGAAIQQWTDHGGTNQQFRLADSDGGNVRLIARHSNKAVEVQGSSTADGANVVQYGDTGGNNQQWQLAKVSGGGDPGGSGCGKAPTLRSGAQTIQSSGKSRSFVLRVPDGYDNTRPYRLIFGFHWNGGTMNDVSGGGTSGTAWSYYGMQEQSNNSAILVAPQGLGNGWANSGGEDVVFVDDMVKRIEADLCVDPKLRFAMGFSYGGGMSYSLACSRPTVFRAVVVYAGGQLSGCSGGTQPVAYFGIHGISDNVLNISAGRSLRDRFVANNGCAAQSPREPAAGSRTHITTTYSCRAGYPVQWAAFDGGHGPGPVDGCSCEDGVRTWTKGEAWKFISQF